MNRLFILTFTAPLLCLAQSANAQYYSYHSSTAAEGRARGMSEVVRSAGETNLRNSEAAINYQDARSAEYDNRLKGTETYFEMRKMNKAYRDEERRPPPRMEDVWRRAREAAPKRPTTSQVDPLTGTIAWPFVLQEDKYQEGTAKLERLFAARAAAGGSQRTGYSEVRKTTEALLAQLKANIGDYTGNDYTQTKRFLEGLRFESQFANR
ncbi:MAG: hypothetical protein N2C14_07920 [Planctomycetales bacterium]